MPEVKIMPHNLEAEQAVLGCILIDSQAQSDIFALLQDYDFYSESHQNIYNAMLKIYKKGVPVDFVTLADQLELDKIIEKVGGIEYITFLTNSVPSAANFNFYCDIVKSNSIRRQLIKSGRDIIEKAYDEEDKDEALKFGEESIFNISEKQERTALEHIGRPGGAITNVLNNFDKIAKNPNAITGIPTGFKEFDAITNGLQNSDLILLAARPSVGKTSLAMNIVTNAAIEHGKKCAVFSLEMSREQLVQRAICSVAKVSMAKALNGTLTPEEWQRIFVATKKLEQSSIYVDDSSMTRPTDILSKCRRLKAKDNIDLIMVDYIQLMTSDNKRKDNSRQVEVGDISRTLKVTAKELNVPILVLSQLSRAVDARPDHRPILSDLRDSGAIEQDADIVLFLFNPEKYNDTPQEDEPGTVQLIIAKHRRGRTDTVKLRWIGEYTTFVNRDEKVELPKRTPEQKPSSEEALEEVNTDVFDD